MARARAHRLSIAGTWDGEPLPPSAHTLLLLHLGPRHLWIAVDAPYHGDPPPPSPPGPTAGLWEHEVVELFLAGPGDSQSVAYTEVELSPHGHHLVLRLQGVRRPLADRLPLRFRRRLHGDRWQGVAALARELLPPSPWRANAFAVHGHGPDRRFLAATPVPGPLPDFHQPERFPPLPPGFADARR